MWPDLFFSAGAIDPFAVAMCKGSTAVDTCLRKYLFCGSLASSTAFKLCLLLQLTLSVRGLTNGLSDRYQAAKQSFELLVKRHRLNKSQGTGL